MPDREKVINELHDARQYLEDKEWSDRCASPHIDAINDALVLLKEQDAVKVQYTAMGGLRYGACPQCNARIENLINPKACGFCGQAVKWE